MPAPHTSKRKHNPAYYAIANDRIAALLRPTICVLCKRILQHDVGVAVGAGADDRERAAGEFFQCTQVRARGGGEFFPFRDAVGFFLDRKSTRLNSSHPS